MAATIRVSRNPMLDTFLGPTPCGVHVSALTKSGLTCGTGAFPTVFTDILAPMLDARDRAALASTCTALRMAFAQVAFTDIRILHQSPHPRHLTSMLAPHASTLQVLELTGVTGAVAALLTLPPMPELLALDVGKMSPRGVGAALSAAAHAPSTTQPTSPPPLPGYGAAAGGGDGSDGGASPRHPVDEYMAALCAVLDRCPKLQELRAPSICHPTRVDLQEYTPAQRQALGLVRSDAHGAAMPLLDAYLRARQRRGGMSTVVLHASDYCDLCSRLSCATCMSWHDGLRQCRACEMTRVASGASAGRTIEVLAKVEGTAGMVLRTCPALRSSPEPQPTAASSPAASSADTTASVASMCGGGECEPAAAAVMAGPTTRAGMRSVH